MKSALFVFLVVSIPAMPQQRSQARSMVITSGGIVATSQTLASQAGAQVLARGGTAMDAALAANAVLTVVEPMSCGMGGDLFALYYDAKTKKLHGLNASGGAPVETSAAASPVNAPSPVDAPSACGAARARRSDAARSGCLDAKLTLQPAPDVTETTEASSASGRSAK